jgi:4-hydroxy-tetrahydrodipicolinate reductase
MTKAVVFGLGTIGCGIARLAVERGIELAGGIDLAPDMLRRPLHEVVGIETASEAVVSPDAEAALRELQPDIVLHATGSYLPDVLPQLISCAQAGTNVVSTCEELSFPWKRHPELAKQLDSQAKAAGVTVLGTGVNPGFVMDTLAVALSGACQRIDRVRLMRVVDVATRRLQLQQKVGAGLSLDEFKAKVEAGRFGHVGLQESCWMLAEGLGWRLESLEETIEAVPGAEGQAAGMRQTALGTLGGKTVIDATVQMSAGADRPRDEIEIDGTPPVRLVIEGGIPGEAATAAVVVNAVRAVIDHPPGLITMLDLSLIAGAGAAP